jgi:hypothetical protein
MMDRGSESRAVALALRCYPRSWKARHGDEAAELAWLLARDGIPAVSIAVSYFGGALRMRLGALAVRHWRGRARALAVLATGSVAALSLAVSTLPAPAGASGVVRVELASNSDAASQLMSTFRSHHFDIAVRQIVAPASQVGSIVAFWVTGHPAASSHIIGEIKGPCADRSQVCIVGLVIPANFTGQATVLVGEGSALLREHEAGLGSTGAPRRLDGAQ